MSVTTTASDQELLRRYVRDHAEDAFAELVHRHVNLVHSAALRQVHSPQLAEEVAQSAFTDLARQAHRLAVGDAASPTSLTPWLYQVTRRTAVDVVRREARRRLREQIATDMNALNTSNTNWAQIEPLLDEAVATLEETDRAAILLRYFENQSLREVGTVLGISDDAAQKRVSRAVERLREFFAKHGVSVGASALVVAVSANAVQVAPAGLALTISTAATFAGMTSATATVATATTQTIAMTTLQKALLTATIAIVGGAGLYEAYQVARLRGQLEALQQQQAPLKNQLQLLQRERQEAGDRLAAVLAAPPRSRTDSNQSELLRLRAEVARLRSNEALRANDPAQAASQAWIDRLARLKQRLAQTPGARIPEFKYLSEDNWLDAASNPLVTEADYRRAFAALRRAGENQFIIELQGALGRYLKQNGDLFPTDLAQLKPHFEAPPEDAMLERYAIVPADQCPNIIVGGDSVITVKQPVDEEFDSVWALGSRGFGSSSYQGTKERRTLETALKANQSANNGQEPKSPDELLPYLTTAEQRAAFQKLKQQREGAPN